MPIDPVMQHVIEHMPPLSAGLDFVKLRDDLPPLIPLWAGPDGPIAAGPVDDVAIPGAAGRIAARVIRPATPPVGTIHLLHGGGWVLGGIDYIEPFARRLCRDMSMVVVISAYRLAPENPFPAPFDDALAAARWVLGHAGELGGANNPVIIGGESAGGNLAAAVALQLRNDGATNFDAQMLLFPAVDLRRSAAKNASYQANADPTLLAESLPELYGLYCGAHDRADPRISPLASASFEGLPPAVIVVLSVDPLRDEGFAYAEKLNQAGVNADVIEFDDLVHGFTNWSALVPAAAQASAVVMRRLELLLADRSDSDRRTSARNAACT